MSIHVISLVQKIQFGDPYRKGVALKLAWNSNDEGSSIKPSVETIAHESEVHERTVQRILKEWLNIGLITLVHKGGSGPRDPNEYAFDMALLHAFSMYATKVRKTRKSGGKAQDIYIKDIKTATECQAAYQDALAFTMGDTGTPSKGDREAPLKQSKGDTVSNKGGRVPPEPSRNNIYPQTPRGGFSQKGSEENETQVIFHKVGCSEHVRKNFLEQLEGVKLRKNHTVKFFYEVCRYLENNNETALKESARRLRAMPYLPTKMNDLLKICSNVQALHMVVIRPEKNPDAWEAWEKHIRKSMPYLADQMKNLSVSYIEKPTLYPPTGKRGPKHGA